MVLLRRGWEFGGCEAGGGWVFVGGEVVWCLLEERGFGVCYGKCGLVLVRGDVVWCLLGERWLGVC